MTFLKINDILLHFLKIQYFFFFLRKFILIFSSLRLQSSFSYILYNREILLFSLKVGSNNIGTNSSFIVNLNFATILGSFPTLLCSRLFLRFLALKQIQIPRDSFQIGETFLKKQKREREREV